jgi:hypothetical protein
VKEKTGKRLKNIIWVAVFAAALIVTVRYVLSVLEWKDGYGLKTWDEFYEIPRNSTDILCYGSSHNMCTVNHGLLWNEYGFTSASAGNIGLGLRTTYYYIRETLNYQSPKVILLEMVYTVWDPEEFTGYEEVMALNQSPDRAALVKEIYGEDENYMDYLLGLPVYHTRYWEISKKDFTGFGMYSLGYYGTWNLYTEGVPRNFSDTAKATPIDSEKLEWLEKIVQLCKDEGIELVFYLAPYNAAVTPEEWDQLEWVEQYAQEIGVPMINFNKLNDEIGLDFSTDYADNHHLNVYGGAKVTTYLGKYLQENYDLEDHRGQKGYSLWENCYMRYEHEEAMYQLQWTSNLTDCLERLDDENFVTVYSFVGDDYGNALTQEQYDALGRLGLKKELLDEMGAGTVIASRGEILYRTGDTKTIYSFTEDGCDYWIRIQEDGTEELVIDQIPFSYGENGIYTVTSSRITGQVVDRAFFSPYNGFLRTEE